jgi:hypothetical protein
MAFDPGLSKTPAKAALDAIVDSLDTGTGTANLKIFSGAQPASPDTGTGTTLASMDVSSPAFGAAATGTGGDANYVTAERTGDISDTSADATGTAAWYRLSNKSGVAKIDGSVGTATADLILDSVSITAGQTVKVTNMKVRLQYKN